MVRPGTSENQTSLGFSADNYELLFRRLFWASWVIIAIYVPLFYFLGSPPSALIFLLMNAVVFPFILYSNNRKPRPIYKALMIFCCNFCVYFPVVNFVQEANGEYYYPCALMLSMILFNSKERGYLYFSVASSLVFWSFSNVWKLKILDAPIHIQIISYETFQHINFIGSFTLGLVLLRILMQSREELERKKETFAQNSKLASLGRLAAGVGHEINNPLTIANGYVSLISSALKKDNYQNEQVDRSIAKYHIASERIRNIVDGLRISARANNAQRESFNLVKTIEDTVMLIKEIYKKENVDVKWSKPDRDFFVLADTGKIQQTLMNIISNAKDAVLESNTSDKRIIISVQELGNDVVVKIADNGSGIPLEIQSKIFDSFFTTKEVGKGTGMGLSISHSIVKSYGGTLTFVSEAGGGTEFTITLPVAEASKISTPIPIRPRQENTRADLEHRKVLIVDDEADIRTLLRDLLEEFGCECHEASDGAEGLRKLNESSYDLVFTDIQMPNMNGVEFTKAAQEIKGSAQFIVVTGGIGSGLEEQKDFAALVTKFIYKPFRSDQLADLFRKAA